MIKKISLYMLGNQKPHNFEIPQWQKNEVRKRMEDYKANPSQAMDFDAVMVDIEKGL